MALSARFGSIRRQPIIRSKVCPPQQRYRSYRSSLFLPSTYQDPTLVWARSNPRLAQECLRTPPIDRLDPSLAIEMDSLESYLEWRGWKVPNERNDEPTGGAFENAQALVSHIMSAPLTVASKFKILTEHFTSDWTSNGSMVLNWCCVGARAEASIPTVYWEEFLLCSKEYSSSRKMRLELSIEFIGPDIPLELSEQSVGLTESQDGNGPWSLTLRGYHRGFFHDIPAVKANSKIWDAFLLFNPGLGHPNLRKAWEPTLKLLLDGGPKNPRKRPIMLLLTAHSEKDMARDAAILTDFYGLKDVVYQKNPFASRVAYEDPFEKNHFVRPNHYVATVMI